MFEDRRRRKRRRRFAFFFIGVLLIAAFSIGYYLNLSTEEESNSLTKISQNLKIPDSLKDVSNLGNNTVDEDKTITEDDYVLKANYKVKHITFYTVCGHSIERETDLPSEFFGLKVKEFMERNPGWDLVEIKDKSITLSRIIDTYCPKHFIIGLDGQYIAIYVYDENGEKILKEKTDINIATLTPEDQEILRDGIVADTVEDLEQKLEGFSN